jgi:hypothetical protein
MKLGEALTLRSQLQMRFKQLAERLMSSSFTQEGEPPPEDPDALLHELEEVAAELEGLVAAINRTNLATVTRSSRTLTDALARRDYLTVLQAAFHRVAESASEAQVRYGRTEIKLIRTVDVVALRRRVDELAKERRELDAEIQEANWQTELTT